MTCKNITFFLSKKTLQFGCLFLLGTLGGMAHLTPFMFKIFIIPSVLGALWLMDQPSLISHKGRGMFFYFWGYFVVSLYWISFCFQVDVSHFWWLIIPTALGLPGVVAIFNALPFWGFRSLSNPYGFCILFSALWILGELTRSIVFTGLPWALAGQILADVPLLVQGAAFITTYGLSLLLIATVASLYLGIFYKKKIPLISMSILWTLLGIWGASRCRTPVDYYPLTMRLVQPNIAQTLKWDPGKRKRNLETLLYLSQGKDPHRAVDIILWPEAAVPFLLEKTLGLKAYIMKNLPGDSLLITGFDRYIDPHPFNSLGVLNKQGTFQGIYDKHHLVPFGEYIPLRKVIDAWFPGKMRKIAQGLLDTVPGPGPRVLKNPGIPSFLPQICYEIGFPYWLQAGGQRPPFDWVVNVTNDAWFGDTAGPYQHLNLARLRAVEYGVPVVRVANTGITAVIDPYGRILQSIPLNQSGYIDIRLPKPLK